MSLHPLWVRSMRTGVASRRIGETGIAGKKLGTEAQRIVVCVTGAKHPLVAAHAPHAAAYLVGKGLEAQRPVAGGQRTGDGGAGAVLGLGGKKNLDGFLESAFRAGS
jgi:hypothetical protein